MTLTPQEEIASAAAIRVVADDREAAGAAVAALRAMPQVELSLSLIHI